MIDINIISKQLIKIAKQLIAERKSINRQTDFFKSLIKYKVINGKQTYKNQKGFYYQFDELHGHWQVYNKNGKHLFVVNQNGCFLKDSVQGRKINLK